MQSKRELIAMKLLVEYWFPQDAMLVCYTLTSLFWSDPQQPDNLLVPIYKKSRFFMASSLLMFY